MSRNLLGGRIHPDEQLRGALVVKLALARREVAVHGRLHERVDEADRRFGAQDLRADELAA